MSLRKWFFGKAISFYFLWAIGSAIGLIGLLLTVESFINVILIFVYFTSLNIFTVIGTVAWVSYKNEDLSDSEESEKE